MTDTNKQIVDESLQVAIVGGGIGGLSLALALQLKKIDCVVFERDEDIRFRRQGYGMTLTNNPKGPLAKLVILFAYCIRNLFLKIF